jgi:Protein of unknown function (DUF1552)
MKFDFTRRLALKGLGLHLSLPVVATVLPGIVKAAGSPRKRFIGAYVPNGAHMPDGVNGNWTWDGALAPLVAGGFKSNTAIMRGFFNGFPSLDPHWQNCSGFLSCTPIEIGDPGVARCGKTVDQYVAEAYPTPTRSIEVGGIYYHIHPLTDHPGYSNDYLNRISWQTADKIRSPIPDPKQLFQKLFAVDQSGAANIAYLHARKKSVLDQLHKDADRMAKRLPMGYQPVLQSYMETVREVEKDIDVVKMQGCSATFAPATENFDAPNQNYLLRFQKHHQMLALALQCGLTNAATIMYGPGVSENMNFNESLGKGGGHHQSAHHGGQESFIERIKAINTLQVGLLADLLKRLKEANVLDSTLVLYGSDMSDGNVHLMDNLPMLLCGAGADVKFGQEIGSPADKRPLSDVHMEIFSLLGISSVTSFGSGRCLNTSKPLGLRA